MTPWTVAHQAPLSMGFSRQEYWSGLPFTSPGDLPDPGSNPYLLYCRWLLMTVIIGLGFQRNQGFVVQSLSPFQLFATPWTVAHQAPFSP